MRVVAGVGQRSFELKASKYNDLLPYVVVVLTAVDIRNFSCAACVVILSDFVTSNSPRRSIPINGRMDGVYMRSRIVILFAFTLAAGCGGSTGQVRLSLTDSPSDLVNVSQVIITVDEVRIHDDASSSQPGAGPDAARDGVDGGGWIILCSDVETLDLLQLTNGRFGTLCPEAAADGGTTSKLIDVPAGRISQLRLHLASARLIFNDGTPSASLTVPSGSTSGLKINIDRDVPKGGLLDVKLDFNAASSISRLGDGSYRLGPVLTVLP